MPCLPKRKFTSRGETPFKDKVNDKNKDKDKDRVKDKDKDKVKDKDKDKGKDKDTVLASAVLGFSIVRVLWFVVVLLGMTCSSAATF